MDVDGRGEERGGWCRAWRESLLAEKTLAGLTRLTYPRPRRHYLGRHLSPDCYNRLLALFPEPQCSCRTRYCAPPLRPSTARMQLTITTLRYGSLPPCSRPHWAPHAVRSPHSLPIHISLLEPITSAGIQPFEPHSMVSSNKGLSGVDRVCIGT